MSRGLCIYGENIVPELLLEKHQSNPSILFFVSHKKNKGGFQLYFIENNKLNSTEIPHSDNIEEGIIRKLIELKILIAPSCDNMPYSWQRKQRYEDWKRLYVFGKHQADMFAPITPKTPTLPTYSILFGKLPSPQRENKPTPAATTATPIKEENTKDECVML